MVSQPPSQPQPPPAVRSASQPAAIQCASSSVQSYPMLPESPSSLPKPLKSNGFIRFLLCQPGRRQHSFWMPEAPKVTPSDLKIDPRSSQAFPKWSLQTPKVILPSSAGQCTQIPTPDPHPSPPPSPTPFPCPPHFCPRIALLLTTYTF